MTDDFPRRPPRVLTIECDPLSLRRLDAVLTECGYVCLSATTAREALDLFERQHPDVIIIDQALPDMPGLELLRQMQALGCRAPVLITAAQGTALDAIEAMKQGAFDYLSKPLDMHGLAQQVARAMEVCRLTRSPVERARRDFPEAPENSLLGNSHPMQSVWKAIGRAAAQDGPVLVQGEPGTGKELTAHVLHRQGPRASAPLVILKCTGLGQAEVDGDLYGSDNGAGCETGAHRTGKVEQAAGGTLFIDDVGALPLPVQSKLVRLLTDGRFERRGGAEALPADVNVIAAATQPLGALVQRGDFRADLLYLLSTFTIELPPLRQRREDIPLLVDHFIKRFAGIGRTFESGVTRASPTALNLLIDYDWPGNIDELQSVIRRAIAETGGTVIDGDYLQWAVGKRAAAAKIAANDSSTWRSFVAGHLATGSQSLYADAQRTMEQQVMQAALDHTGGNQAQAAKILGITRGHLRKKIRLLGLSLLSGEAESEVAEPRAKIPPSPARIAEPCPASPA